MSWLYASDMLLFPDLPATTLDDRLEGCLKLGAVGDALGYMVEFYSVEEIIRKYGPEGIRLKHLLAAQAPVVSDDTQMTLFTAEGIREALDNDTGADAIVEAVSRAYVRWHATQVPDQMPTLSGLASSHIMNRSRAPGMTCMSACADGANGTLDAPINHSDGCGGIMRVAPLAFVEGVDAKGAMELGMRAAALTHGHPSAWISAGAFTHMLWEISRGQGVLQAVKSACEAIVGYKGAQQVIELVDWAVSRAGSGAPASWVQVEYVGAGWNGREALAVAVYSVIASNGNPEEAMEIAAFHSGDSDSTASLAGQLAGAVVGWKRLSSRMAGRCYALLDATVHVDEAVGWLRSRA